MALASPSRDASHQGSCGPSAFLTTRRGAASVGRERSIGGRAPMRSSLAQAAARSPRPSAVRPRVCARPRVLAPASWRTARKADLRAAPTAVNIGTASGGATPRTARCRGCARSSATTAEGAPRQRKRSKLLLLLLLPIYKSSDTRAHLTSHTTSSLSMSCTMVSISY